MKKLIWWLLTLFVVFSLCAAFFGYYLLQPVDSSKSVVQRFVIPKGQAVSVIADRLAQEGLVHNPYVFRFVVRQNNLESKLQSGSFDLTASMSAKIIAQTLTKGTEDVWVTIPEGWRREQVAHSLGKHGLESFSEDDFLELSLGSEGHLFPDTYLVPREITTQSMHELLITTFDQKINQDLSDEVAQSERDFDEVLVMASIVEREARGYEDMRRVAGVLWNRVDIGMALQADATLQYAKGFDPVLKDWWTPPLGVDRELESPYNTYLHSSLPPAPISNPGLDALRATLSPEEVDDLFYIHDSQGKTHFARTLEGHNANIAKYLR